ncbi:uncharacterized protein LOC106072687 [Biomphalaria glabrata]|uniref:Uncharacterized protein LOC106072687 n=1 Tax=Biomphalaria glabrata TaxID=6526 RepID=A0A9W2ZC50_BIOGL|nr:uncharacterized protein LOC106072687 [Biomphalaria glabrata]KAI8736872.1 hypothetical protein BgiMline_026026 [Biomphalaria glabrata]
MIKPVILCLTALVSLSLGHVCLVSPQQRGDWNNVNSAASPDCALTTGPCGGRTQDFSSATALVAGKSVTVTIQKNNNHYNAANPGYFTISLGATEATVKEVKRIPDTSDPSLSLYSATVNVPSTTGHMILQVTYVTNTTPTFYQCSDVLIVASPDTITVG